jgi:hypothetical protein
MFFVSHASATAYALVNKADWTMASVFARQRLWVHTHSLLTTCYLPHRHALRVTEIPHHIELR